MYIGKYGLPQQSYYSFINAPTAYAACVDNHDSLVSGLWAWGCQVQEDWKTQGSKPLPNTQGGIGGLDKELQKKYPQQTVKNSQNQKGGVAGLISSGSASTGVGTGSGGSAGGGGGTPASKVCGGCNAGDIGCELGKLSCEFTNSAKNWWDGLGESVNKGTGGMGLLPIIAIGGGLLIVVLLARR